MSTGSAMSPVGAHSSKEVPQPTEAYRKAHKIYVLVSGLLASWELIGVSLETKEKWGIELKSPKAVPLILFTLVFYTGYKMTVEWLQCDPARRQDKVAKLDFNVAHLIAIGAIGISVIQYLARIQVVDLLNPSSIINAGPLELFVYLGLMVGFAPALSGLLRWKELGTNKRLRVVFLWLPLSAATMIYLAMIYRAWGMIILA